MSLAVLLGILPWAPQVAELAAAAVEAKDVAPATGLVGGSECQLPCPPEDLAGFAAAASG